MLSPQFALRVSSRRSLLEKAQINIKESRRIRDNLHGANLKKDTKFFDSAPSTVDEYESKELEETPPMIDRIVSVEEMTEMKEERESENVKKRDQRNVDTQIEQKSESKVETEPTPPIKVKEIKTKNENNT